ncbi:Metal tolerance protein 3, partial [Linum grandiflorum]
DIDSLDFLDRHLSEPARHDCAIQLSNLANVFLLVFKLLATFKSGSLVVGASTVDSLLDLMDGGVLWFTHSTMKRPELYKYPIEKLRSQPVGILAFGCIMATLGLGVLIQGVRTLVTNEPAEKMTGSQLMWMCVIMVTATLMKLSLWFYCRNSVNHIVQAYANDHYFDVITNIRFSRCSSR